MSTTFYDNFGIKITDAVFETPKGDQYPIRNISSVKIRKLPIWIILIPAAITLITATNKFMNNHLEESSKDIFYTIILIALYWYLPSRALLICTGGKDQPAIRLSQRHASKFHVLNEVSGALNASISNLQKT